jgi:PAS domain S-box-containing protein
MPLLGDISDGGWVAIIGGVATICAMLGAGVQWVFSWIKARRMDALIEYQTLLDATRTQYSAEIQTLRNEIATMKVDYHNEVVAANAQHQKCMDDNMALKVKDAQREGEVRLLQMSLRQVRDQMGLTSGGAEELNALIVANASGIIRVVSPNITPLLHYEPKDLLGKSIFSLVLDEDRVAAEEAFGKMTSTFSLPWPAKTLNKSAKTKEGGSRPVCIELDGWRDGAETMFSAKIYDRPARDSHDPHS